MELADRVQSVPPYPFAALNEIMAGMRREGRRVINLGIGDPDTPPPPEAFAALRAVLDAPGMHRYPDYAGDPEFRAAVGTYYGRRFGVRLDTDREVLGLIGSKEGLAHLLWAVVNPGDVVLLPDPAYPVYAAQTRFAGGDPYFLPLIREHDFLPDLGAIPEDVLKRAKVLVLCYPNAPTAALAPRAFFREALAFARTHGLILVNDGAYLDVILEGEPSASLLEEASDEDQAVEFYSLSKTFHLTGWRVAAAVGSSRVLDGLRTVKENTDSGQWTPLQRAGAALLTNTSLHSYVARENDRLRERRDRLLLAFGELGLAPVTLPRATLYLWLVAPGGDGAAFASRLLARSGVVVTPGEAFGPSGKPYVRISLSVPDEELSEAAERIVETAGGAF